MNDTQTNSLLMGLTAEESSTINGACNYHRWRPNYSYRPYYRPYGYGSSSSTSTTVNVRVNVDVDS